MSGWSHIKHDIVNIAEDALHTAVSPIEGPVNAWVKTGKDIFEFGKDVVNTVDTAIHPKGKVADTPAKALDHAITRAINSHQGELSENAMDIMAGNVKGMHGEAKRARASGNIDTNPSSTKRLKTKKSTNPAHRSINTGSHNMVTPNDGDEVAVVPPPAKIAKTIPDYTTIKLGYYTRVQMTTLAPSMGARVFRLNSIFDPDLTLSGHQPLGRDHWITVYRFYRVLSSDVTIKWYNATTEENSNIGVPLMVGYELTDDSSDLYSDFEAFVEGKHSKADILLPNSAEFRGGGGKMTEQKFHYSPELWDVHVHEQGVSQRWTAIGEDPANKHLICLHSTPCNKKTEEYTATCMIYISYTVQFRELQSAKKKTADS